MDKKNKPTLIILIGMPATGKTSLVSRIEKSEFKEDFKILSTDDLIDSWATAENSTYNQLFHDCIDRATKLVFEAYQHALDDGANIIFDQTSLTKRSREKKLSYRGVENYRKVAVVFKIPESQDWKEYKGRIATRQGKFISDTVLSTMVQNFEFPNHEGFNDIYIISHPSEADHMSDDQLKEILYGEINATVSSN